MTEQLKQLIFPTCSFCSPISIYLEVSTTEESCAQNTCGWQPCQTNNGQVCNPDATSLTKTEQCQDYYFQLSSTDDRGFETIYRKKINECGQCEDECPECVPGTSVYTIKTEYGSFFEETLEYTTTMQTVPTYSIGGYGVNNCTCQLETVLTNADGSYESTNNDLPRRTETFNASIANILGPWARDPDTRQLVDGGQQTQTCSITYTETGPNGYKSTHTETIVAGGGIEGIPIWQFEWDVKTYPYYPNEGWENNWTANKTEGTSPYIFCPGSNGHGVGCQSTATYNPPLQTPKNVYTNLNTSGDCNNIVYPNTPSFSNCNESIVLFPGQTLTNDCSSNRAEVRRAYHFVNNPKNTNVRNIRSLKYRVVHSKPETCYLKVWLTKIIEEFTFDNNIGCGRWSTTPNIIYTEPLGTYEWSEDYPCTGVYNDCGNSNITTIYGPTSSLITPDNGQKVRVCISKYSLVKDYVPDDPWATPYCKRNGLPSPCCCEDKRQINQNDPISLYCSIC